jgi:hypothetical protein
MPILRQRTPVKTAGDIVPHLYLLPLVGFVVAVAFGVNEGWSVTLVATAIAAAAFLVGALTGFLFGIPRALTAETVTADVASSRYGPNTNLEQISDWLTKIIVGVSLVEVGRIGKGLRSLVDYLAPALGDNQTAKVFALSLVVYFLIAGFLCAYLITRLVLRRELVMADKDDLTAATVKPAAEKAAAEKAAAEKAAAEKLRGS